MKNIFIVLILSCSVFSYDAKTQIVNCALPEVVNRTNSWNRIDSLSIKSAVRTCKLDYPSNPCLKTFIKKAKNNYVAICGRKVYE